MNTSITATHAVRPAHRSGKTTPKSPADVNLSEITVEGLSYPDPQKADRRRGFCACCGRSGFLLNAEGRLARHGFKRPRYWGVTIGQCSGSGMKPQDTVLVAIGMLNSAIERLTELLDGDLVSYTLRKLAGDTRAYTESYTSYGQSAGRPGSKWRRIEKAQELRELRQILRGGEVNTYSKAGRLIKRNRRVLDGELKSCRYDLQLMLALQANVEAATV